MADVMADHQPEMRDRDDVEGSPPPPLPPPPPLLPRRKDQDSRERRDERDSKNPSPTLPPPPPPSAGSSRGGDRDYRRRSSPSPPPYSHRDSRHSPPRRSPPPASKRYRRDDGGYDRRRGSPRGGYGSDDRRYGHDYGRGYDRGYDDRGGRHGRHSDWLESGHGSNSGAGQREGLMSYKQFIQELEDDVLPDEAQRRYVEYKTEYISTQKRAFFELHKDDEWLKDKYHPTNLVTVIERRNENARAVAREFLLELQRGTLDLGPSATASFKKSGSNSSPNSDEEPDVGDKRRRNGRGPSKENDASAVLKAHPVSSDPRRIQIDIDITQALVRKLDAEKAILDNILTSNDRSSLEGDKSHGSMGPIIIVRGATTVKGLEGVELLDTLVTYLFRVHGLDYYGMSEKAEPRGLRYVRADDKSYDGINKTAADWEKKLESFWQDRLQGIDPLEKMSARDKIDAAAVEVLDPYVRKIRDEKYGWKYGCGAKGCTKLFHAAEFVHKHLRLKHPELVMELTSKVREDLYFQNYMDDADAPGGSPVMQQSIPKDRAPRRRPISDRLRDDRGSRRSHEDRHDRTENSPSRDYDSRNGADGNPDETMYDSYDRGAPFPSDIAPPVLMPVPGAGPLGPFVPAPPEVAMRMFREQGDNGGRLRKGRPGPPMGGSAPILAVSPGFPHDPRRIRSYHDLDAPEDEVTVIDYRSL